MQRLYLDQNKWIDLARARTGHALGKTYITVYEVAKAAVEAGSASFLLSSAHYFETHKQTVAQKRVDLTHTMLELSRLDAIAPPHVIVPYEIEAALIEVLGLANEPPSHSSCSGMVPTMYTPQKCSLARYPKSSRATFCQLACGIS